MDKRVFLAITLCAGIFLLWQNFYLKPFQDKQQAWVQQQQLSQPVSNAPQNLPKTAIEVGKVATSSASTAESVTLGDADYNVVVNTKGGIVNAVNMADYRGKKSDRVGLMIGGQDQLELSIPSPEWGYVSGVNYNVVKRGKNPQGQDQLVLAFEDANIVIHRTYTVDPQIFSIDHDIAIQFKKQPLPSFVYLGLKSTKTLSREQLENERRQVFFNRVGGQETFTVADIDEPKENTGEGNWFGFSSRYFLNAISNRSMDSHPQFQVRPGSDNSVVAGFFYKVSGASLQVPVRMYYGPKDIDVLKKAGGRLDSAVDFGWFTIFAYPMLTALKWFYKYVHNFGLAIILLTVLVKLITYPLTLKSMTSMKQMQKIQPQMQRLRERYADDKEALNREMLQLMRANGYNPMGGCLPMFIQMPIFIALYNVLNGAIDLYGQPFFGWIHDLSTKDPLYITPVLLSAMMFVQQKLTPSTAADPAQQRMMMMMPLIFGFMMLSLPSGLTLYMLVNSVVSIAQQFMINRTLNAKASPA